MEKVHEYELTELQYARPEKGSNYKLYLYDKDGFHSGGIWFTSGTIRYPDEQIGLALAKEMAEKNIENGHEVRITDGGDFLVFHSTHGQVLYPNHEESFWERA